MHTFLLPSGPKDPDPGSAFRVLAGGQERRGGHEDSILENPRDAALRHPRCCCRCRRRPAAVEVVAGGGRLKEGPVTAHAAPRGRGPAIRRASRRPGCTVLSTPACCGGGCGGGGARRAARSRSARRLRSYAFAPAGQAGGFGNEGVLVEGARVSPAGRLGMKEDSDPALAAHRDEERRGGGGGAKGSS